MPPSTAGHDAAASGDLVRLEYDLWAESGDRSELVDTTHESVAQAAELKVPAGFTWGPRSHLIGGDFFPTGIENALVGLKVGEEIDKEFAPADAFGTRDPKLIELFTMHEIERLPEMRRDDATLELGTILTIRGRRGRVVTLTAARVRVDFNPPFAGRKIRAKFRIDGKIDSHADQVRALVDLTYGHGPDFGVDVKAGEITLKVPERTKFDLGWAATKPRVIDRLRTQLKPKVIRIVEEYVTPVAKDAAKEEADAKPAAETKDEGAAHGHEHTHAHGAAHAEKAGDKPVHDAKS